MLIPTKLIHQVYHTLSYSYSATANTCNLLDTIAIDCDIYPAFLVNSIIGRQCGFNKKDNPDYNQSLKLYFQAHPESLI